MTAPNQTFPTFVNPSNFDVPLVVAINQEGGSVRRIKDGASANFPSAADMAKKSDAEITQIVRSVAKQLKAAGINTNFAPVLDISPADGSTVKFGESRVFGSDPAQAARLGDLFAKAMLQEGVNPVYKHFGGGSMDSNTDLAPASVPTMGQLKSRDFQPYKTVSKTPQTGLMLGSFKPSDGATNGQPANQSKLFYDLAINTYGFTGPLFTDDIGTKAAGGKLNIDFIDALQAGATMPLYVQDPSSQILENQILGIIKEGTDALNAHTLSREQLAKAVSRNAAAIGLNACQVATGLNN